MDYYIGEIRLFPYNRIPSGWVACNGQQLQVNQNQALFALISSTYGPTDNKTFVLPNLNGRAILGFTYSTPTGTTYTLGQVGGTETVALDSTQMPAHNHQVQANNTYDSGGANTHYLGNPNTPTLATQTSKNTANANFYAVPPATPSLVAMAPAIGNAGSSAGHENRGPYLAMNYCICTVGLYPSRP
jgi:microcystin-dependent protein